MSIASEASFYPPPTLSSSRRDCTPEVEHPTMSQSSMINVSAATRSMTIPFSSLTSHPSRGSPTNTQLSILLPAPALTTRSQGLGFNKRLTPHIFPASSALAGLLIPRGITMKDQFTTLFSEDIPRHVELQLGFGTIIRQAGPSGDALRINSLRDQLADPFYLRLR